LNVVDASVLVEFLTEVGHALRRQVRAREISARKAGEALGDLFETRGLRTEIELIGA
jgi:hypothetical protein